MIVQGEGRGHLMQAIALRNLYESVGHEVVGVLVGRSHRRIIPSFFRQAFEGRIFEFDSPNFVTDKRDEGIRVAATILDGLRHFFHYWRTLGEMNRRLQALKPDVTLNFFEMMAGFYWLRFRPSFPIVSIANQFLIQHPDAPKPEGSRTNALMMRLLTWSTSWGAYEKWVMSPLPLKDVPRRRLKVVPPIIRQEVRSMEPAPQENFILAYVVNNGYAEQLRKWHEAHPELEVHCFWDNPDAAENWQPHSNFTFHRVNSTKYLDYLKRCRGIAGTAGFQSTCEAMYLNKPFLVVSVAQQYEQQINAYFIEQAGIGHQTEILNLQWFMENGDMALKRNFDRQWLASEQPYVTRLAELTGTPLQKTSRLRLFRRPRGLASEAA